MEVFRAKIGESIDAFFNRAVECARVTNVSLTAKHNDLVFSIGPTDDASALSAEWWRTYGNGQER